MIDPVFFLDTVGPKTTPKPGIVKCLNEIGVWKFSNPIVRRNSVHFTHLVSGLENSLNFFHYLN